MATEKFSVAILRTRCLRCFDLIFLKFPKSICHLTYFSKNRTWTDDFVLIPAWHLQFNTNLLRENKDKCSLFFYAVSRGDFLFTVRKIIIITVNRKEFSMKYKDWLDVWFANYIEPSSKTKTCERYSEIIEKHLKVKLGEYELEELSPIVIQKYITEPIAI